MEKPAKASKFLTIENIMIPKSTEEQKDVDDNFEKSIANVISLPSKVVEKSKNISMEISKNKKILEQRSDELARKQQVIDKLRQEASVIEEKTSAVNASIEWKRSKVQNIEKLAFELVSEKSMNEKRLKEVRGKLEEKEAKFKIYHDRMKGHIEIINELEKKLPVNVAIKEQEKQLEQMELVRKAGKTTVESSRKLRSSINEMNAKKIRLIKELQEKGKQAREAKDRQRQLSREMELMKKRRQAQMIRLKSQLKESQSRNKQLSQDVVLMEIQNTQLLEEVSQEE